MRRPTTIWLAAAAAVGIVVATGVRFVEAGLYDASCFYTAPIGPKTCDIAARDAAGWSAFWSALGFLNVFWILMVLVVLFPKRWQKN